MSIADSTVSTILFSLLKMCIHTYTYKCMNSGLNEEMGEGAMTWKNTVVRLNHLFGTTVKTEADVEMMRFRTQSQQSVWGCSWTEAEENLKSRCTTNELCVAVYVYGFNCTLVLHFLPRELDINFC